MMAALVGAAVLAGCGGATRSGGSEVTVTSTVGAATRSLPASIAAPASSASVSAAPSPSSAPSISPPAPGPFTIAFAGDVHFTGRVADRLAEDPATAFGVAAAELGSADLTMVNLETAITTSDAAANKSFTFKAPPAALTALKDAGIDVATMANNHGADYGQPGLTDTLAAISTSGFPVIGIGANAAQAYAPYRTTLNGTRIAIFAASQIRDETLQNWTAGANTPGIASAWSAELIHGVTAAKAAGDLVIVYLHWGVEYTTCPSADQRDLADQLANAGAIAVIGTHAHVLQGAGWRADGVFVAFGLSNYLWWRSFGNEQDDNGVLTVTFSGGEATASSFAPAHLDDTGVPVPATGATKERIDAEWERDRKCADLAPARAG